MNRPHALNVLGRALLTICACHASLAAASVVMTNTRVIFAGDAKEQNLQFTNLDDSPSVMQVWVDAGDAKSTPDTADAPFLVNPPIFRIEPRTGQTARLIFVGSDLPQDRESIFYLNSLQIPSLNAAYADQNRMLVMLRNRIKVFYRPATIEGSSASVPDKLALHLDRHDGKTRVVLDNPTGYFVSVLGGSAACGTQVATFTADMVAPRSSARWVLNGACPPGPDAVKITIRYVNDYGAVDTHEYRSTRGPDK
ncbi:molecular chaperone [Burkholderia pseudomultivorans]|uniref:fimbrial biogenesis chaperone n=1 Tax=Burkholderia pseudomultivorans TaxID=1207504 RepID=UPI00188E3725|nr:molecular chaperone [Burkholderia pseudomultivorans]MBF5009672.1 molecular chaperone [Burkholderia pseudomultivorans]